MARTQLRLDSITGSYGSGSGQINQAKAKGGAFGSMASSDVSEVLSDMAAAIKRIHGTDFANQDAGLFTQETRVKGFDLKVQESGGADKFVVSNALGHVTGSGDLVLRGNYIHELRAEENDFGVSAALGKLKLSAGLNQPVQAVATGTGFVEAWAGGSPRLVVTSTAVTSSVIHVAQDLRSEALAGGGSAIVFQDGVKNLRSDANLKATSGGGLQAAVITGSNLTAGRVVYVGDNKQLVDEGGFTYNASTDILTVGTSTFGLNVVVAGDLTVNGTTTTVNSTTLSVDDKNIELAHSPGGAVADDAGVSGGGITLKSSGGDKTITWENSSKFWTFSEGIQAPSGTFSNLSSKLVKASGGKLVDALAMDFITGTLNQVNLTAGALAGSVVLSLPQSIDTNADVEFDSLKLGDLAADAGKALKVGADGAVSAAAWNEFVSIEANVGLELIQDGFKAQVGLAQDLRSTASPQFAALNIGTAHDIFADGADLKLETTGYLKFDDAEGAYELAKVGEYAAFNSAFVATSIVGALVELAAGGGGGKGKEVIAITEDVTISSGKYPVTLTSLDMGVFADASVAASRLDVYLNGQLMVQGASGDYAVVIASDRIDFAFPIKAEDVVVAIIR
jgi:hypothetical protein